MFDWQESSQAIPNINRVLAHQVLLCGQTPSFAVDLLGVAYSCPPPCPIHVYACYCVYSCECVCVYVETETG